MPFGRPVLETFTKMSREIDVNKRDSQKTTFLFAPTLRKDTSLEHPFRLLQKTLATQLSLTNANILWSMHPLEETGLASGQINMMLHEADYVITDYSSIVYEAFLLKKKVLFYVPDIEEYRDSPGLNTDPEVISPEITFRDMDALIAFLQQVVFGDASYCDFPLKRFVGDTFDEFPFSPAEKIVEHTIDQFRKG